MALRDDGHRAGGLLQHLAQRTARTRLCLCGFILRLLHLDRPGRTRRARPDRLGHPTQGPHGSRSRYGRLHGRTGHSRGPELGRSRPFAPHDGPRHRLELLAIGTAQCHHHQLRRQRHLSPVVQSGGGRRAPGRADHEHELPGRRMVHRRDENQSQRCARRPLHVAAQQIHLYQRHNSHIQRRGPSAGTERGHRLHPQRRSAYQIRSGRWTLGRLPAEQPLRAASKQGQRDRFGHCQGVRPRPDGRYDLPGTAQTDDRQERDDAARHAGPFRLEASDPLHTGLHSAVARTAQLPPVRRLLLPPGADLHPQSVGARDRPHRSGLHNAAADRNIPLRQHRRSPYLCGLFHPIQSQRLESP